MPMAIFPSTVLRRPRITADGGCESVDFSGNEDASRQTTVEDESDEASDDSDIFIALAMEETVLAALLARDTRVRSGSGENSRCGPGSPGCAENPLYIAPEDPPRFGGAVSSCVE